MIKKILFLFLFFPIIAGAQHTVTGTLSPAEDYSFVILYRIEPSNVFYTKDTAVVNGKFQLELVSTVPKGIYRLVYGLPQETNYFDLLYNAKEDIEFTFNAEEGVQFLASEENMIWESYRSGMKLLEAEIENEYASEDPSEENLTLLFKTQQDLQKATEKAAQGKMVLSFVMASKPYIPTSFESYETYIENKKNTYLKYINFTNKTLQNSGFLLEKSLIYLLKFTDAEESPEGYNLNIDTFSKKIASTELKFQKDLQYQLWHQLIGYDKIDAANHLAIKHLIPIAKQAKDTKMVNELFKFQSLSLNAKAPNFSWKEETNGRVQTKWLHKVDSAENYILAFWSSSCSHCLNEIPKLHNKIDTLSDTRFKVIAIGLEDEPYDWKNTVHDFPKFINVLGLGKWENDIGKAYDISATPTYFVLDKDKKIIAKPEDFDTLLEFIEH